MAKAKRNPAIQHLRAGEPGDLDEELWQELAGICSTIVEHADALIDLAFEMGGVDELTREEVKRYIRFIVDRRLEPLGLAPMYHIKKNSLPWLDEMLGA
ncbi:MAG: ribonucleotide-diphosphate reductase subunit beta, partial [Spirosoma sp.]|nr:ribonucleotide-diphosphate reductase subunit beta [Spirosoma sp.]